MGSKGQTPSRDPEDVIDLAVAHLLAAGRMTGPYLALIYRRAKEDKSRLQQLESVLAGFESQHGNITYLFVGSNVSVIRAEKDRRWLARTVGAKPLATLHISMAREAFDPDVRELVDEAYELAIQAERILRSADRHFIVRQLTGIVSLVVGEAANMVGGRLASASRDQLKGYLSRLREEFDRAATRGVQLTYLTGMLIGLPLVAMLAVALGALLNSFGIGGYSYATFASAWVAGALGGFVSVLSRMAHGGFSLSPSLGRPWIRVLGITRPFIGAIFGAVAYLAFAGELVGLRLPEGNDQNYFAMCVIAFFMGFSERFAQDMFVVTETAAGGRRRTDTNDEIDLPVDVTEPLPATSPEHRPDPDDSTTPETGAS